MEKLSIEEKAKAYDEALKKARQLCAYPTTKPFINDLQDLFPELQEPEDERIKKTLINFFSKGAEYDSSTNGIKDRNIIAWLEKQGKGKLTDKPKFKVGDWITDDEAIFHITSYDIDYGYQLETVNGTSFHYSDETLEKYRLWTIADAKDGDVLTNGDFPCIFKRCDDNGSLYVYCGINAHNDFSILSEDPENVWDDYSKQYFPATKEQRDTFFAKMKESGYEWLEETNELKKIEQKPWSEEDELMFISTIQGIEMTNGTAQLKIDWLKSLKERIGG